MLAAKQQTFAECRSLLQEFELELHCNMPCFVVPMLHWVAHCFDGEEAMDIEEDGCSSFSDMQPDPMLCC